MAGTFLLHLQEVLKQTKRISGEINQDGGHLEDNREGAPGMGLRECLLADGSKPRAWGTQRESPNQQNCIGIKGLLLATLTFSCAFSLSRDTVQPLTQFTRPQEIQALPSTQVPNSWLHSFCDLHSSVLFIVHILL